MAYWHVEVPLYLGSVLCRISLWYILSYYFVVHLWHCAETRAEFVPNNSPTMQCNTTPTQSLAQTVQKSTMSGAPIPCSGTSRTSDFYSIFRFHFLVKSVADFTKVHTMKIDPLPSGSLVIVSKVFQPVEQSSSLLKVLCCSDWLKAFFEQKISL